MMKYSNTEMRNIWMLFLFTKILWMMFAVFIFPMFSTLGDTDRYLAGPLAYSTGWYLNSTAFMDTLTSTINIIFGKFLTHLFFLIITFIGIYYPMRRIILTRFHWLVLFLLLSTPNFGIWTSVASKESITVFFLGIMLNSLINLLDKRKQEDKILIILSIYLCLIFKPQYLIAFFAAFFYIYITNYFIKNIYFKFLTLAGFIIIFLFILFTFRDMIDELAFQMVNHFSLDGRTTRENTIWINPYDVFWNAPYGMLLAFFGPTFQEATRDILDTLAFIESFALMFGLFILLSPFLINLINNAKININYLSVFIILIICILFVHYPFGVLNPGSALRYRSGFLGFIICLCAYFAYALRVKSKKNIQKFH